MEPPRGPAGAALTDPKFPKLTGFSGEPSSIHDPESDRDSFPSSPGEGRTSTGPQESKGILTIKVGFYSLGNKLQIVHKSRALFYFAPALMQKL